MILGILIVNILLALVTGQLSAFSVKLTEQQLRFLANAIPVDYSDLNANELSLIEPLLMPRAPGTAGHKKAFDFIVAHFKKLDWHVEVDSFNTSTPAGAVSFSNIMVSSNPLAHRKLVLSAHYDSKPIKGIEFVGATVILIQISLRILLFRAVF